MPTIPRPTGRPFNGSVYWPILSPNELDNVATRDGLRPVSTGDPLEFGHFKAHLREGQVAFRKLITNLGIGDPKVTTEEQNRIHCRVAIFIKKPMNTGAGSRVHLVRRFSLRRLETSSLTPEK